MEGREKNLVMDRNHGGVTNQMHSLWKHENTIRNKKYFPLHKHQDVFHA